MFKLFPDKYQSHVKKYHVYSALLATMLIIVGFGLFIFFLFNAVHYSSKTRFILSIASFLSIILGFVLLLFVRQSVSADYHKIQLEMYSKKLTATSDSNSRVRMLDTFSHKKYNYRNAGRRHIEQNLFVISLIIATTYLLDAITFGIILAVPLSGVCIVIWIFDRMRKSDFIKISADGISYSQRGESGFAPWNSIKEIQHVRKTGYLIKTSTLTLNVNNDIEPDEPMPGILKRFFFDYRYAKELVDQIVKIAPHIPCKKWKLE